MKEDDSMHCIKKVTDDLLMIGGNDRRIALFENVYPVPDLSLIHI